jgi:nucleosome binding factor SPN SPT16 subunit
LYIIQIGIEFRESQFLLSSKNTRTLNKGQVLNLTMGFQNLENKAASDEKDRIYALFIGDLAHVETESSTFLTGVEKTLDEVSFTLGDDDEDEDDTDKTKSLPNKGFIIEQKLRNEKVDLQEKLSSEAKRRAHQKQLAEARQLAGLRKFSGSVEEQEVNEKPVFRKFESYRKDALMPKLVGDLKVPLFYIDCCRSACRNNYSSHFRATSTFSYFYTEKCIQER